MLFEKQNFFFFLQKSSFIEPVPMGEEYSVHSCLENQQTSMPIAICFIGRDGRYRYNRGQVYLSYFTDAYMSISHC